MTDTGHVVRPRVVALGGGHGLASTLAAVARYTDDICAVVSVADDGGSSGRLLDATGLPALGDLRKAVVALARSDSPLERALSHRFEAGDLHGHALGNLLLAAMAADSGDLVDAIAELGRLVGVVGTVLPNAIEPVVLCASTRDGRVIQGQVAVMGTAGVQRVWLDPIAVTPPQVLDAIARADQVILGPGSLFTSVLACLAAPAITEAVATTTATTIYVCNLSPQLPETGGLDANGHLAALIRHGIRPDVVVADVGAFGSALVGDNVVRADLVDPATGLHSAERLAEELALLI